MDDLLNLVGSYYGISDSLSVKNTVQKGVLSTNYVLSDKEKKYFLKRYRFDDPEIVRRVHQAKQFFARGGVPVILPIEGKDGTFFSFGDGVYALFPFIDAIQIERKDLNPGSLTSMANMLAKIHTLGSELPFGSDGKIETWNTQEFINQAEEIKKLILDKSNRDNFDKIALRGLDLKIGFVNKLALDPKDFLLKPEHQIHGDYQDGNVFFDANLQVSHVFDFEKTGVRSRVYEVYRAIDYICIEGEQSKKDIDNSRTFLIAYQSKYPLTKEEVEMGWQVYFYKKIQSLWIEGEHYLRNNFRPDIYIKPHVDSLEYFVYHFDELKKFFVDLVK